MYENDGIGMKTRTRSCHAKHWPTKQVLDDNDSIALKNVGHVRDDYLRFPTSLLSTFILNAPHLVLA
jgi:hypothetical protein